VKASECRSVRMSEHWSQSVSVGSVEASVAELPNVGLGVAVSERQSQSIDCRCYVSMARSARRELGLVCG
jgi:hypothetical protein